MFISFDTVPAISKNPQHFSMMKVENVLQLILNEFDVQEIFTKADIIFRLGDKLKDVYDNEKTINQMISAILCHSNYIERYEPDNEDIRSFYGRQYCYRIKPGDHIRSEYNGGFIYLYTDVKLKNKVDIAGAKNDYPIKIGHATVDVKKRIHAQYDTALNIPKDGCRILYITKAIKNDGTLFIDTDIHSYIGKEHFLMLEGKKDNDKGKKHSEWCNKTLSDIIEHINNYKKGLDSNHVDYHPINNQEVVCCSVGKAEEITAMLNDKMDIFKRSHNCEKISMSFITKINDGVKDMHLFLFTNEDDKH